MNQLFSTDEERIAFILDEEQPDDLKMPLIGQISDDRLLIKIIGSLKTSRRFVDEKEHKELVLAAAQAVRDGELLEEAAKSFPDGTVYVIYPVLAEKCPGYTPEYIVQDKRAASACQNKAFETIRDQAARDGRCLYITSQEAGENWFSSKWGWTDPIRLVYAYTDPYISLADYMSDETGVLVDEEDGRLALWECTPGAFAEVYRGFQCSLYEVPETLFLKEPTNWETIRACTFMAPVVREEKIEDAWSTLASAAGEGLCVIHEYEEGEAYKTTLKQVSERIRLRNEKPLFIIEDDTLVYYAADYDEPVEEVVIPEGVKSIGWHAFYNAWSVENVRIPHSVRVIEEEAFYGCTFSGIDIPEGVTTIGKWAFGGCEYLNEVRIPDSVTSIGPWAFGYRRSNCFYQDPEPVDKSQYHPLVTLIGKKGGEAQRYAEENKWYACCLIAEFKEG